MKTSVARATESTRQGSYYPDKHRIGDMGQRRDIQGLRALAVILVFFYHLWPERLPGGFVGVDVFFVISGFLITGNLLRKPIRGFLDLAAFWGRRIRRLLPVATVVLLSSLLASVLFLPSTVLAQTGKEVAASALYVENWALAASATNYLTADELHSPVQQYWSLSVEEQFYIIWPALFMLALWLTGRFLRGLPLTEIVIGALFFGSLAISVLHTQSDPAGAYFVTPTRMWELAAGGLCAAITQRGRALSPKVTAFAAWSGVALCVASGFLIGPHTPFPGCAALLPVAGSALVLIAQADGVRFSPDRFWSLRPVQVTGDASYSLYLWHWPIIVIGPFLLGHSLGWPANLLVMAGAWGVAILSKRFIEDPVRRSGALNASLPRTFSLGALCMAVTVTAGAVVWVHADRAAASADVSVPQAITSAGDCVGASAFANKACGSSTGPLLTPPEFSASDQSDLYRDKCWENRPFDSKTPPVCHYGATQSTKRIALVGNSHAGHWQPAIVEAAKRNGWSIDTYLASECYVADVNIKFDGAGDSTRCRKWVDWAKESVREGRYDLVIASSRTGRAIVDVPENRQAAAAQQGYASILSDWTKAGVPILVIRDNPYPHSNGPDCVAQHLERIGACDTPISAALRADPLFDAAAADSSGLVSSANLTDLFCQDGQCPTVIGRFIVYSDASHITKSYARTLAPAIESSIKKALLRSKS